MTRCPATKISRCSTYSFRGAAALDADQGRYRQVRGGGVLQFGVSVADRRTETTPGRSSFGRLTLARTVKRWFSAASPAQEAASRRSWAGARITIDGESSAAPRQVRAVTNMLVRLV